MSNPALPPPQADYRRTRRQTVVAVIILTAVSILPYLPALRAGWFFDSLILLDKPYFQNLDAAAQELWRGKWTPDQSLSLITFALNCAVNERCGLAPTDPRTFIAINVVLHAVNALLLYFLVLTLTKQGGETMHRGIALVAAAVFAVHPLQATSITYIVQRRGILATLFYLSGLLSYLRARRDPGSWGWYLLTAICLWSAMHSKTFGATLPIAILTLEFCLRALTKTLSRTFVATGAVTLAACAAGAALLLSHVGVLDTRAWSFRPPQTMVGDLGFTWGEYLLTQARSFARYWLLVIYPAPGLLCLDHDFRVTRSYADWASWSCVILHLCIILVGCMLARRGAVLAAFGILLFYVALLAWIAPPQPVLFAEYRLYLPVAAAAIFLAGLLQLVAPNAQTRSMFIVGSLVTIILAAITWQRNGILSDNIQLWSDVVSKNPDQFRGHYNLANALYQLGRYQEAADHYRNAGRIDAEDPRCHFNLGNTLLKLGKKNEAAIEYQETLRRNSRHAGARTALQRLGMDSQTSGFESAGDASRQPHH